MKCLGCAKAVGLNSKTLNFRCGKFGKVRQILSEHIPDDEAKLLSNGRLTCMICQHRPIFDCVKTLSQHRIGKRHLIELGKYLKCKSEHEYKKLKNNQLKELKPKVSKSDKLKPKYLKRKMVLSPSTMLACKPKIRSEILSISKFDSTNTEQNAATQVKTYLKSIKYKNGFEKTLEEARDSYGVCRSLQTSVESTSNVSESKCTKTRKISSEISSYDTSIAEHELKLKMSGWLKDPTGNWIKNPDVEFDSDEDEPPLPSNCK